MGSINEKNQRPKISCYCPFKYMAQLLLALRPCFCKQVSTIHHFQFFTNSFPHYQEFGLKWQKNVFCKNQDGVPLKLRKTIYCRNKYQSLLSTILCPHSCFLDNIFKGTVSPEQICLKMVWLNRPKVGHMTLDF